MRTRQAITVRAADRVAANAALQLQGYGPECFSVELIPTSQPQASPPATHYGLSWSMSDADKVVVENTLTRAGITFQIRSQQSITFEAAIALDGRKKVERGR